MQGGVSRRRHASTANVKRKQIFENIKMVLCLSEQQILSNRKRQFRAVSNKIFHNIQIAALDRPDEWRCGIFRRCIDFRPMVHKQFDHLQIS